MNRTSEKLSDVNGQHTFMRFHVFIWLEIMISQKVKIPPNIIRKSKYHLQIFSLCTEYEQGTNQKMMIIISVIHL